MEKNAAIFIILQACGKMFKSTFILKLKKKFNLSYPDFLFEPLCYGRDAVDLFMRFIKFILLPSALAGLKFLTYLPVSEVVVLHPHVCPLLKQAVVSTMYFNINY